MSTAAARASSFPEFEYLNPDLRGERFHDEMRRLRESGWLASMPLGFVVLDREGGEFFLRSRSFTFPGMKIAEIFGIDDGPLYDEIRRNILHINGADHSRLRGLVNPAFTPRAVERWRPFMRETIAELFAPLDGRADGVEAIAKPYPSRVIATLMGAPIEDAERLWDWSNLIQRQFGMTVAQERPQIEQAVSEFYEYTEQLLAARREQPGDDLVSTLMDRADDVELINLVLNVLVGGVDTTQAQLAHGLRLFRRRAPRPVGGARRRSLTGPGRGRRDRPLRADHAVHGADRDGGRHLPRRDVPARHDRARVRADRQPGPGNLRAPGHVRYLRAGTRVLTFGAGPHYCLGVNLARAEMQEALAYLAPRMPDLRLDGEPAYGTIDGIYGLDALPLRWHT